MPYFYLYVDESFGKFGKYHHSVVGGALVPARKVVDIEIALQRAIQDTCSIRGVPEAAGGEFKYTKFFPDVTDQVKLEICRSLVSVIRKFQIDFCISHASVRTERMPSVMSTRDPGLAIQMMAAFNLSAFLAPITRSHLVQMMVDLGLNKSFRPQYEIHASGPRSIPQWLALGVSEASITTPNFRRLPGPAFIDSKDSRLLQFSDLVLGLSLAEAVGKLTAFSSSLLQTLAPIRSRIKLHSVEWNKSADQPDSTTAV